MQRWNLKVSVYILNIKNNFHHCKINAKIPSFRGAENLPADHPQWCCRWPAVDVGSPFGNVPLTCRHLPPLCRPSAAHLGIRVSDDIDREIRFFNHCSR